MSAKTKFSRKDLEKILSDYSLGKYKDSISIAKGTVQTNLLVRTTEGKFVFRYYENRSKGSVLFESSLISYLENHNFPCPSQFKNKHGAHIGVYKKKPYILFEFIEGKHVKKLDKTLKNQLIKKIAQLHCITKNHRAKYRKFRWNYSVALCAQLAKKEAKKINTANSRAKLKWLINELKELKLPKSLPKGICHCDFHFSNILFKNRKFVSLLDFDDANYTFLAFDLISLIDLWAWPYNKTLKFHEATNIIKEYVKHRSLKNNEKKHLYDLLKLQILFDCIWFFERGNVDNFHEKRKIAYLNNLGRNEFHKKLF
ncbi:MAG: homoserine kinase [Elusimicrobia bacterium]|nr:homoserine kinase [Elusimicrobiota bacterium]